MSRNPTEEQLREMQERVAGGGSDAQRVINATLSDLLWNEASIKAKANMVPRDRGMNKTETKFSHHLEAMKRGGEIADWRFEPLKFRLADMTTYTPDFLVIGVDGSITLVDTKAYWKKAGKVGVTEDANVKIKVVSDQYPWFTFQIAWEQDGIWQLKTH